MLELCLTILGMGIVTYVPRMLPLVILNEIKLPPRWHNFFRFIPYAALGALIFPGILTATGSIPSALAGFTAALLLAFGGKRGHGSVRHRSSAAVISRLNNGKQASVDKSVQLPISGTKVLWADAQHSGAISDFILPFKQ